MAELFTYLNSFSSLQQADDTGVTINLAMQMFSRKYCILVPMVFINYRKKEELSICLEIDNNINKLEVTSVSTRKEKMKKNIFFSCPKYYQHNFIIY